MEILTIFAFALLVSSYLGVIRDGRRNVHGGYGHHRHHRRHRDGTAAATAITRFLGRIRQWRIVGAHSVGIEERDTLARFKGFVVGLRVTNHGICNETSPYLN